MKNHKIIRRRKATVSALLALTMPAVLFAGCGNTGTQSASQGDSVVAQSEDITSSSVADHPNKLNPTYALVPKSSTENQFNVKEAEGFVRAVESVGGTAVVSYPEQGTAEAQISAIETLIEQKVDAIAVAANDKQALSQVLQLAEENGIKICTVDADVAPENRAVFCNQAGVLEIGHALMDAIYDISGGEGEYAILSASAQSTNQNAWIDAMKDVAESDDKYSNLILDEIVYGDDMAAKSAEEAQDLLDKYPNLKAICAPTTVGIAATAKVIDEQGSSVKLTGLGLPSEMADYIGDENICPYMFLWNPIDLGALAGYTSVALLSGDITGSVGESFTAGDMGLYTITANTEGATEIILGQPFRFDSDNIEEWKEIY